MPIISGQLELQEERAAGGGEVERLADGRLEQADGLGRDDEPGDSADRDRQQRQ